MMTTTMIGRRVFGGRRILCGEFGVNLVIPAHHVSLFCSQRDFYSTPRNARSYSSEDMYTPHAMLAQQSRKGQEQFHLLIDTDRSLCKLCNVHFTNKQLHSMSNIHLCRHVMLDRLGDLEQAVRRLKQHQKFNDVRAQTTKISAAPGHDRTTTATSSSPIDVDPNTSSRRPGGTAFAETLRLAQERHSQRSLNRLLLCLPFIWAHRLFTARSLAHGDAYWNPFAIASIELARKRSSAIMQQQRQRSEFSCYFDEVTTQEQRHVMEDESTLLLDERLFEFCSNIRVFRSAYEQRCEQVRMQLSVLRDAGVLGTTLTLSTDNGRTSMRNPTFERLECIGDHTLGSEVNGRLRLVFADVDTTAANHSAWLEFLRISCESNANMEELAVQLKLVSMVVNHIAAADSSSTFQQLQQQSSFSHESSSSSSLGSSMKFHADMLEGVFGELQMMISTFEPKSYCDGVTPYVTLASGYTMRAVGELARKTLADMHDLLVLNFLTKDFNLVLQCWHETCEATKHHHGPSLQAIIPALSNASTPCRSSNKRRHAFIPSILELHSQPLYLDASSKLIQVRSNRLLASQNANRCCSTRGEGAGGGGWHEAMLDAENSYTAVDTASGGFEIVDTVPSSSSSPICKRQDDEHLRIALDMICRPMLALHDTRSVFEG